MQTDAFKIIFIVLKENFKYLNHRFVVVNLENQRLIIIHMRLFFSSSMKSKKINKVMGNAVNLNIILWILMWLNAYMYTSLGIAFPAPIFIWFVFVCLLFHDSVILFALDSNVDFWIQTFRGVVCIAQCQSMN